MDTEFEAKFYPVNKPNFHKKLKSIGAELVLPECKMRRTLIDSRYHPEFACSYIRIRDEGNLVRLSAKTSASQSGKLTDQKEIDVTVSDYDKTVRILESMGFKFDTYQESQREIWHYEEAEIVIDTWPGLESYSEIEAKSEAQVRSIAEKLGFDWNKKIITPVAEVYADVYHLSIDEVVKKITYITFESNPFASLPRFPIPNAQPI